MLSWESARSRVVRLLIPGITIVTFAVKGGRVFRSVKDKVSRSVVLKINSPIAYDLVIWDRRDGGLLFKIRTNR